MIYLPEKAWKLATGHYLLFFLVEEKALASLEFVRDSEEAPRICFYPEKGQYEKVLEALKQTKAVEVYAQDFRISWTDDGRIGVMGKISDES